MNSIMSLFGERDTLLSLSLRLLKKNTSQIINCSELSKCALRSKSFEAVETAPEFEPVEAVPEFEPEEAVPEFEACRNYSRVGA